MTGSNPYLPVNMRRSIIKTHTLKRDVFRQHPDHICIMHSFVYEIQHTICHCTLDGHYRLTVLHRGGENTGRKKLQKTIGLYARRQTTPPVISQPRAPQNANNN